MYPSAMQRRTDPPTEDEVKGYYETLQQITCDDLKRWLAEGRPCSILDVRTEGEWLAHRIPGATLVPIQVLDERLEDVLAIPGPLVVHCEHGVRSMDASLYLLWQGRRDVVNVIEGLCAWTGPSEHGPKT